MYLYITKQIQKHKAMKTYSELYTVEEWIEYFNGAGRHELKSNLKSLGNNHLSKCLSNKRDAIIALLA